jgi:hypothetical protein
VLKFKNKFGRLRVNTNTNAVFVEITVQTNLKIIGKTKL